MHRYKTKILIILAAVFTVVIGLGAASAQDDNMVINHQDVFKNMTRPQVKFPHTMHADALSGEGCGACHHVEDKTTHKLVYSQGEEAMCNTCHGLTKNGKTPALKEAFHQSCTGCHRKMKKMNPAKKGPTTCGECHTRQSKQ